MDSKNTVKTEDGLEVYENKILEVLDDFIITKDIPDMNKASQNIWNAALIYIYNNVFKNNKSVLKRENYEKKFNNSMSNNNAYDLNKINDLLDFYISLCYQYEKEVSLNGFSKLTGINTDVFYMWAGVMDGRAQGIKPSPLGLHIYKKLNSENEESLSDMLISGNRAPVAILGALNHRHNWNVLTNTPELEQRTAEQTAADIAARHVNSVEAAELPEIPQDILKSDNLEGQNLN